MTSGFNRVGGILVSVYTRCLSSKGGKVGTSISRATRSASTEELVWELGAGICVVLCEACHIDEGGCGGWVTSWVVSGHKRDRRDQLRGWRDHLLKDG